MKIKKFSQKPPDLKDRIGAKPIVCYSNINIEDIYIHKNYFSDGSIWTNAWLTWTGSGQTTGNEYSNRAHFDYKWEDGKIVEVLAYFDETAENNEIAAYTASLEN